MIATDREKLNRLFDILEGKGTLTEARTAAGLSIGQAAKFLGWPAERLRTLESGAEPTDGERAALCKAYDVEGWVPNDVR